MEKKKKTIINPLTMRPLRVLCEKLVTVTSRVWVGLFIPFSGANRILEFDWLSSQAMEISIGQSQTLTLPRFLELWGRRVTSGYVTKEKGGEKSIDIKFLNVYKTGTKQQDRHIILYSYVVLF